MTEKTGNRVELGMLVVDAVLLAALELLFLPLRFDGSVLPAAGGWPFPVTVLAALVTVPLLVHRASALVSHGGWAGLPLYAWVVVVVGFGVARGPGGDALLPGDWRALLLVAAGAVPGAAVLGNALGRRPRRKRGGDTGGETM